MSRSKRTTTTTRTTTNRKRGSIYEPLERRTMMCLEPGLEDLAHLPAAVALDPALLTQYAARLAAAPAAPPDAAPDGGGGGANIVWGNRNSASNNFANTFGVFSSLAMGVVDEVLAQYERVIGDFNYTSSSQFTINISMRNQPTNPFGGQCPPDEIGLDASGAPRSANVYIGAGNDANGDGVGDGIGWFLDPTPEEFSEFSTIVNAFVGDAPVGSPANGLRDLYSMVAHEVGHAMGMTSAGGSRWASTIGLFATDTGFADLGGSGNTWAYQSNRVGRFMLTDSDGGGSGAFPVHSARVSNGSYVFNNQTYTSARDVMNNVQGSNGRRFLISNALAGMYADIYGYDFVWPEQFGSLYTSLDSTTGQLTLRGGAGASNDDFSVLSVPGGYEISVNMGTDVLGTGPTDAFESFWTDAQVSSIVIDAGDGDDWIEIRTLGANEPVTINAGAGNDEIRLGIGDFDDNLLSNIVVAGGTGTDEIWINDRTDGPGGDVYTLTSTSFSKPTRTVTHSGIERIEILGSDNDSTWNIESFNGDLIADGGDGADTFNVTQPGGDLDAFAGRATLLGGLGADTLNLYDANDTGADDYLFDPAGADNLNFTKTGTGNFEGILYSSMTNLVLEANSSSNDFIVDQMFATNVTLRGNNGNDTLLLGNGSLEINVSVTNLRFEGGGGNDAMILDDSADTGDDTHVFDRTLLSSTYRKTNDSLVVTYLGLEDITLDASNASNTINVDGLPAGTDLVINGNLGTDTAVIGGGDIASNVAGDVHFEAFFGGRVVFNDSSNPSVSNTYALDGDTFSHGGRTHTFANVTEVEIEGSDNADTFNTEHTFGYDLVLRGHAGSDLFNFGGGSLAFMDNATVYGGEGNDELRLDDSTTFAPTTFTVNQTGGLPFVELFNGNQVVRYDSIGVLRIEAGPHADTITSIHVPSVTTLRIDGNGGEDTIDVQGHPSLNSSLFPPVSVDGGAGLDTVRINMDGQGGARATFPNSQDLRDLMLGTSGRLQLAAGGRVIDVLEPMTMPSSGAEIDLTDGFFVRRNVTDVAFYETRITSGYNGGAWNGLGFNSSVAEATAIGDGLGMARANELFNGGGGIVAGINLAANDLLIRYALYGDANLDGTVNLLDFNRVAASFGSTNASWAQGDFNYDDNVNLLDFNALATNFGASV